MSHSPFVTTIDTTLSRQLETELAEMGFTLSKKPYMHFCAQKKGIAVHAYTSGKLVVQGSAKDEFIEFYLEPKLGIFDYTNPHANLDLTERIGADESGKGDFFGPLTVAAVYADSKGVEALAQMGVKDSKSLSPAKIASICTKIRSVAEAETLAIFPPKYNELWPKFGNLNRLLAWAHATCIDRLVRRHPCETIIIDQFATGGVMERAFSQKGLKQTPVLRVRAESDVVVAAASILARAAFVEGLERLSTSLGVELPKGGGPATTRVARALVEKQPNSDVLLSCAKVHFKNADGLR